MLASRTSDYSHSCICISVKQPLGLPFAVNVDYGTMWTPLAVPIWEVCSLKWHVWFASHCPGMLLSTWQMIAASCPTALGAVCGQLTFRLALYCEHSETYGDRTSAATGPHLWYSYLVLLCNPDITCDCSDDSFFREAWTGISVQSFDYLLWHFGWKYSVWYVIIWFMCI